MRTTVLLIVAVLAAVSLANLQGEMGADGKLHCTGECQTPAYHAIMNQIMPMKEKQFALCHWAGECPKKVDSNFETVTCEDATFGPGKKAGEFPCNNIDQLAFVSLADMGCGAIADGSDIWGWYDVSEGHEIAIFNCADGTSFVDVTDTDNPKVLGFMEATDGKSIIWHDVKVYTRPDEDIAYAYVVSEIFNHGMQVFDLTRLREYYDKDPEDPPRALDPDTTYTEVGSVHNIVLNNATGHAYAVGSNTCSGGLHIIDVGSDPADPTFLGCFSDDGYTHDAQCVVYDGPDSTYLGDEICFCFNENTFTIVDVSDPQNPSQISRSLYTETGYAHQGWLTENMAACIANDELDEVEFGFNTRSLVWDIRSLDDPKLEYEYFGQEPAIDHNLYILGDYAYEANYASGLRVMDISNITVANPDSYVISEAGFFDVDPSTNAATFVGSWSNWPYAPSGNIIVSSIERGLFVLKFNPPSE